MAKKKKSAMAARATAKPKAKRVAKRAAAKRPAAKRVTAKPSAASTPVFQAIAPGLTVNDIEQSLAWYRDVLGFAVKERWENEGKLQGAEMAAGNVSFMLGQDDWQKGRDRVKGVGVRLYCTARGIDRLADKIKARGGTLAQEPQDGWGMRTFAIDDPDGYKITFMFPLKK